MSDTRSAALDLRDHLVHLAEAQAPLEAFPDLDEIQRRCAVERPSDGL